MMGGGEEGKGGRMWGGEGEEDMKGWEGRGGGL